MKHAILKALAAVAIVASVGAAPGLRQGEPVVWTEMQGASVSDAGLVKTTASGWNASAIATKGIAPGDGYVELVVSETTTQGMFGLTHSAPGPDYRGIDFAFYLNADKLEIYEQGQSRGSFGKLASGDRLRVAVADGTVQFSRNGTVVYASGLAPTYPLLVAAALYSPGATLAGAVVAGDLVPAAVSTPVVSPPSGHLVAPQGVLVTLAEADAVIHFTIDGSDPTEDDPVVAAGETVLVDHALTLKTQAWKAGLLPSGVASARYTLGPTSTEDVTWIDIVGATASGNTLTKSSGDAGWNAGADSAQAIASLDGYVEVVASERTTHRIFGLSSGAASTDPATVDFGLLLASGSLSVQEQGKLRVKLGAFAEGDRLRVAIEGGVVKYRRNGKLLYTSPVAPALPLVARGLLYSADATLAEVVLSGQLVETAGSAASVASSATGAAVMASVSAVPISARQTAAQAVTPAAVSPIARATLAGGTSHSLGLRSDGTVWAWGLNTNGQLGDATTTQRKAPVQVSGITTAGAIAAGASHSVAALSDGTVKAWGLNTNGQLGDNTTTQRTSPVAVSTLTNVGAVAAGASHSLALKNDGTVWAWGLNTSGQLGDNTTTQRNTPVAVSGLTGVVAVAAGASHSLAVKSDGTVWAWGLNTNGQLGDGTTTLRKVPVQATTLAAVAMVSGGTSHSLAVKTDGTVWAWGLNTSGQVGDNTTTQRLSPVQVTTLASVADIAAGASHSLAVKTDGTVWGWGLNTSGQVGDGTTTSPRSAPVQVVGLTGISMIAGGATHSLAATSAGEVWAWGGNASGQIGDWTSGTNRLTPVKIAEASQQWKAATPTFSIASGTYNNTQSVVVSCLTTTATIHYTLNGVDPTTSDPTVAVGGTVSVTASSTLKAIAWATGWSQSNTASAVYTLKVATPTFSPGAGTYTTAQTVTITTATTGATIHYTTDGSDPTSASTLYTAPIAVAHTMTVKARGFKTGYTDGDVGTANYTMNFGTLPTPTATPAAGTYTTSVTVTVSDSNTSATLRCTTDGTTPTTTSPVCTAPFTFTFTTTTTLKAKAFHPDYTASAVMTAAYAIAVAAPVFTPGAGTYPAGQGVTIWDATPGAVIHYTVDGTAPTASSPTIASGGSVTVNSTLTLKAAAWLTGCTTSAATSAVYTIAAQTLAAGASHSLVAKPDGTVWAWGSNSNGQLGDGTATTRLTPVQAGAGVLSGVASVAAGQSHSLALLSAGTVRAWGLNTNGQLGDGTTTQRSSPVAVTGLTGVVVAIAAGQSHSLAVKSDGTVWAWGLNTNGQLGDGTTTQRLSPVAVTGLTGVVAVAAGVSHSLAIKSDGTVYAWGGNAKGQLGDGTTTQRLSPVPVTGLAGATTIAAGATHSLAILVGGSLMTWGDNGYGQLGDGTNYQRTLPTAVLGNVQAASAGTSHTLAVLADGTAWAWGSAGYGQIGDNSSIGQRTSPVQVPGLANMAAVAAGSYHSLGLTNDRTLWVWGYNGYGQVGDGTSGTNRLSPTQVSDPALLWKVGFVTFSPAPYTYSTTQTVTLSSVTPTPTIYYTLDGTTPTTASTKYTSAIAVSVSTTIKAIAVKTGYGNSNVATGVYELKAMGPTFSPTGGTYTTAPQNVTLSTTTPGPTTIRYTFDSSPPSTSWTQYTAAIPISTTTTIRAATWKTGWTTSDVSSATYTMNFGALATPTIAPNGGALTGPTQVTITGPTGSQLRYTTDGTDPATYSTLYAGPFMVGTTQTVKAKAFWTTPDWSPSNTATATFTITVPTPTFSLASGTYAAGSTVTVSCSDSAATIRYTLNGVDPVATDTPLAAGAVLTFTTNMTLKAKAFKTGCTDSAVQSATYTVTGSLPSVGVLAAGTRHSLARLPDNTLWAWGYNGYGGLGDGSQNNSTVPKQITIAAPAVTALAAGVYHSLALKSDGTAWAWGANYDGQIGDGTTTQRLTPTQVAQDANGGSFTSVAAVSAGTLHGLAMKSSDNTVWAWGYNADGEIGDGTSGTNRLKPTQALRNDGVTLTAVTIAAGANHSLAVGSTDAKVYAWGYNQYGQIGDGTSGTNRLKAVPVLRNDNSQPLTGIVAVAGGGNHSLALTSDGYVYAWGYNYYGQLGDGSQTSRTMAVQVAGLTGVVAIAAGTNHSLALRKDGTVYAWGLNGYGELGDGTTTQRTTPVPVLGLTGIRAIAAGADHNLAMDSTGAIWVWGYNGYSQLGDGSTTATNTPIQIRTSSQWWVATPAFSPIGTSYTTAQTVTVTCATSGAAIYYTTDGSEPTTSSTLYTGPFTVGSTQTVKAKAWLTGMNTSRTAAATYSFSAPAPTASPAPGTFTSTVSVALSTTVTGGTIRYTTDGSTPTTSSPTYTSAIPVNVTTTIRAAVWNTGWDTSYMFVGTYTLKVPTPTLSVTAGTYSTTQTVAITSPDPTATLRYTTDGAEPTQADPVIASGGTVTVDRSLTLKAKAWKTGWTVSDTLAASYVIWQAAAATPTFSPVAGSYAAPQTVIISTTTANATIHYTTDGTTPTQFSPIYSLPVTVNNTMTLKAVAFATDTAPSTVGSATYTITLASVATPQLSLTPGAYAVRQTVTLTCATSGATIHYTTNGIDPTEADPGGAAGASVPVTVDRPMTLKARASMTGMTVSPVARGDFDVTGAIAAGQLFSLALKADRTAWAWGYNANGQLGDGTTTNRNTPVQVTRSTGYLTDVVAIAGGTSHAVAAMGDGTVWAWGFNNVGQLGNGSTTASSYAVQVVRNDNSAALTGVVAVAAGNALSMALDNTGQVWAWGSNDSGQVGNGTMTASFTKAVQVLQANPAGNLTGVVAIAAGGNYCLALKADGTVWAWGQNNQGQIGDGTMTGERTAISIGSLHGVGAIASHANTSYAIRTDGTRSGALWAWGSDYNSQVGDGNTGTAQLLPERVLNDAAAVAGGDEHTLALVDDGLGSTVLWSWGDNTYQQLGLVPGVMFEGNGAALGPAARPASTGLRDVIAVAGGIWHSLALMRDGTVRAWGNNTYGQLGLGATGPTSAAEPTVIPGFQIVDASWALADPDGDGLTTGREWRLGTDPLLADSNGDGIADGAALAAGKSATNMDVDGDGIPNAVEIANGTNPFLADSDGDGVPDALDCFPLDPTRSVCPPPIPGDVTPPGITLGEPTNAVLISSVP
jgi:alpha-tubulin suppressor-like RCC1 family protein